MRFIAGNYNGKNQLAVQTDSTDSKLDAPHSYLSSFKFHSDFSMLRYLAEATFSVSFVARTKTTFVTSSKKNSTTYFVPKVYQETASFNINVAIDKSNYILAETADGEPITSSTFIAQNGGSFRRLTAIGSGTNLQIICDTVTYDNDLPAYSTTVTAYLFAVADTAGSDPDVLFRAQPGRVTFGQGKFDSNVPYMIKTTAGSSLNSTVLAKSKTINLGINTLPRPNDGRTYSTDVAWVTMAYRFAGVEQRVGDIAFPAAQTALYIAPR